MNQPVNPFSCPAAWSERESLRIAVSNNQSEGVHLRFNGRSVATEFPASKSITILRTLEEKAFAVPEQDSFTDLTLARYQNLRVFKKYIQWSSFSVRPTGFHPSVPRSDLQISRKAWIELY
jgi:hypothetical protein